jgi:hypothetical protein
MYFSSRPKGRQRLVDFTTMHALLFFTSQRLDKKYNKEKFAILEVFMEETRHN